MAGWLNLWRHSLHRSVRREGWSSHKPKSLERFGRGRKPMKSSFGLTYIGGGGSIVGGKISTSNRKVQYGSRDLQLSWYPYLNDEAFVATDRDETSL